MASSYQKMAQKINSLQRGVEAGRAPQIINTTIEGGAIPVRDLSGQLTALFGQQHDGTFGAFSVAGPNPPKPDDPIVEPVPGGLLVRVPGTWGFVSDDFGVAPTPIVSPMDFSHYEIHATTGDPGSFTALMWDTKKAEILGARGGTVRIDLPQDVDIWVRVIARSLSGKVSVPSDLVGPFRVGKSILADLAVDWDAIAGNTVFYDADQPVTDRVGDLWLEPQTSAPDSAQQYIIRRWDGTEWVELVDQSVVEAALAAEAAQAAAQLRVQLFTQPAAPIGLGATDKAIWIDNDDGNVSYTWSGTDWDIRKIGNSAIQPNSLVASNVLVTGTVTAALLESLLVLATTIVAGDSTGEHTRLDALGLTAYAKNSVQIGWWGRSMGGADPLTGEILWNVSDGGDFSGRSVSVRDTIYVRGVDLAEQLTNVSAGLQVWYGDGKRQSNIIAEFGVAEAYMVATANRNYELKFGGGLSSTVNDGEYVMRVRATYDGSRPTTNSQLIAERTQTHRVGARWQDWEWSQLWQRGPTDPLQVHLLLTLARGTGQATGTVGAPGTAPFIRVADAGPIRPPIGTNLNDGNPAGSSAPATARQVYKQPASWSVNFRGDGTIRTDTTNLVQGYEAANGDGRSMFGWPDLTAMLAGAQLIESVKLTLYAYSWAYQAGGTALIGTHAQTAAPATPSGTTGRFTVANWARAQQRQIDLTSIKGEFQSGASRGIILGPSGGTNLTFSGRFAGATDTDHPELRPYLEIVYYK